MGAASITSLPQSFTSQGQILPPCNTAVPLKTADAVIYASMVCFEAATD